MAAAYVADLSLDPEPFVEPHKTQFFSTLAQVRALVVEQPVLPAKSLAEARRYQPEDLRAIAEIGWHYLMSGGTRLAFAIFDALHAMAPSEPYFALALGLCADRMGDKPAARRAYAQASRLDAQDPRPHVNLAELHLEAGELEEAVRQLRQGRAKARQSGDSALETKASAILEHLGHAAR